MVRGVAIVLVCAVAMVSADLASYMRDRAKLVDAETAMRQTARLSAKEAAVDAHLQSLKSARVAAHMDDGAPLPSLHIFHSRDAIEHTELFARLQAMPKGAMLHLHENSRLDLHWIIANASYRPDCYTCFDEEGVQHYAYFSQV